MKRIGLYILFLAVAGQWPVAGQSVFSEGRWWKMATRTTGVYHITTGDVPALAGTRVDSLAVYGMGAGMLSTYNSETPTDGLRQLAIEVRDMESQSKMMKKRIP